MSSSGSREGKATGACLGVRGGYYGDNRNCVGGTATAEKSQKESKEGVVRSGGPGRAAGGWYAVEGSVPNPQALQSQAALGLSAADLVLVLGMQGAQQNVERAGRNQGNQIEI